MRSLTQGRFFYAMTNKPISAGHTEKGTYVDENRKLDSGFCVKGFQEFAEPNASAPKVQLQIARVVLAVIVYRRRNCRALGVSGSFLRSGPLKRDAYAKPHDVVEKDNIARKLLKPLYGMGTACKDWRKAARDLLANGRRGGEVTSVDKSVFFWTPQGV